MASHLRYLLVMAGHAYSGPTALKVLSDLRFPDKVKTKADVISAFNAFKNSHRLSLWIFREKRRVNSKSSRYKRCCMIYGTGKPPKFAIPNQAAPQHFHWEVGGIYGGNNQQPGLAVAPRRANRGAQAAQNIGGDVEVTGF